MSNRNLILQALMGPQMFSGGQNPGYGGGDNPGFGTGPAPRKRKQYDGPPGWRAFDNRFANDADAHGAAMAIGGHRGYNNEGMIPGQTMPMFEGPQGKPIKNAGNFMNWYFNKFGAA